MGKKKKTKDWVEKREIGLTKDKNCLRSKDVAYILNCSPDDVIELARKGKLDAHKTGRFWRFKLKDVTKYQRREEEKEV